MSEEALLIGYNDFKYKLMNTKNDAWRDIAIHSGAI
jgi:hypothetical protein